MNIWHSLSENTTILRYRRSPAIDYCHSAYCQHKEKSQGELCLVVYFPLKISKWNVFIGFISWCDSFYFSMKRRVPCRKCFFYSQTLFCALRILANSEFFLVQISTVLFVPVLTCIAAAEKNIANENQRLHCIHNHICYMTNSGKMTWLAA